MEIVSWETCADLFRAVDPKFTAWKESQDGAYQQWSQLEQKVLLLFFPTGEGKSQTSLSLMVTEGYDEVVVVAPPKTHAGWERHAKVLGMTLKLVSVEKFRMADTKFNPRVPIIMDEFHKLGGHGAAGWKKFNRMAVKYRALGTPIIMASATPNYNDAERVFCLTAIGDSQPNRNYGKWLFENCETKPNPFGHYPLVEGFLNYPDAIHFLKDKEWVAFVEDKAEWQSHILRLPSPDLQVFEEYGLVERLQRVVASDMEKRHKRVDLQFIDDDGYIRDEVLDELDQCLAGFDGDTNDPWLIFCNHKTVAQALSKTIEEKWESQCTYLIDGDTPKKKVPEILENFLEDPRGILIGTTALATGVDGIDKHCKQMIILDDIEGDPSLRRQLIGRILPRGTEDDEPRIVVTATFK